MFIGFTYYQVEIHFIDIVVHQLERFPYVNKLVYTTKSQICTEIKCNLSGKMTTYVVVGSNIEYEP